MKFLQIFLTFSFFCLSARALVLHPDFEPPVSWSGRPSASVVGKWGSNGTCVVISPDCVVTTSHQGGGAGTPVVITGHTYYVAKTEKYSGKDVRVAKLRLADFSDYVPLYSDANEVGKRIVMAGWGKGRGEELTSTFGQTYGYKWADSSSSQLRWGTNTIDTLENVNNHSCIEADFDGPGATDYETVIAEYDSGGGWFVEQDSQWLLAGLSYTVEDHGGESWFKSTTGLTSDPDRQFAHRVSEYASWIVAATSALADCGTMPEDINEDCIVDINDIQILAKWWASDTSPDAERQRADINGDGAVDILDFAKIAAQWDTDYWQSP